MNEPKTTRNGDQKKQYTVPATDEVCAFVTRITNKYSRAVVTMHPTDDDGPMDAGLSDCALFTAALGALDERLRPEEPAKTVEFVDQFKKKRGPHSTRDLQVNGVGEDVEHKTQTDTPPRKRAVSAAATDTSKRKGVGSF